MKSIDEEKARGKMCPFLISGVYANAQVTIDDDGAIPRGAKTASRCKGSYCMSWESNADQPDKGYCNLLRKK